LDGAGEAEVDAFGTIEVFGALGRAGGRCETEVGAPGALEERIANCFRISAMSSSSSSSSAPPESDVAEAKSAPARPALSLNNLLKEQLVSFLSKDRDVQIVSLKEGRRPCFIRRVANNIYNSVVEFAI
jgi:hypothetical protein